MPPRLLSYRSLLSPFILVEVQVDEKRNSVFPTSYVNNVMLLALMENRVP